MTYLRGRVLKGKMRRVTGSGDQAMSSGRLVFRVHALQRMASRVVGEVEIRDVLENGEVIEARPDDLPYPTRVMLGWIGGRPIHVVATENEEDETVIVTVYEPEPDRWADGFTRRRKP